MRALTVRQPYAWAIMHGGKDVENRSRNIAGSYRGPIAITASVQYAPGRRGSHLIAGDIDFERDQSGYLARSERFAWPYRVPARERGVILGLVDLVSVHHAAWNPAWPDTCYHPEDADRPYGQYVKRCSPWALAENWHLVLANPRPLPTPIPVRGRLGLWTLPDDVAAQVEEALR